MTTERGDARPGEVPVGLVLPPVVALGFVAAVALGALAPPDAWWALALLVGGCAGAGRFCPPCPALVLGLLWALPADGFVVHRLGRLAVDGPADLVWLVAFLAAALLGARHRFPHAAVARRVERILTPAPRPAEPADGTGARRMEW